jgi:hypothetical protein
MNGDGVFDCRTTILTDNPSVEVLFGGEWRTVDFAVTSSEFRKTLMSGETVAFSKTHGVWEIEQ